MQKTIETIQIWILTAFFFLFPLFFLPFTSEPFTTSKFYLLAFTGLLLLSLTTLSTLLTRKLVWNKSLFDAPLMLFVLTVIISLVFVSPNKISAALNPIYGAISIFFLVIITLYATALKNKKTIFSALNLSAVIIAILSIVAFFNPLKNIGISQQWEFIKSPYFSPIGGRIDLILLSLFMSVYWGTKIFLKIKNGKTSINSLWGLLVFFILFVVTTGASIFSVIKPLVADFSFNLTPYKHSWFAAVETLKGVFSALFGFGVDNFSTVFARARDLSFNQSPLWDSIINSSRSTVLHIFTTTGLFGLLGFLSILFGALTSLNKLGKDEKRLIIPVFLFVVLAVFLSTPTLFLFFIFFTIIAVINNEVLKTKDTKTTIDLKDLVPLHFGIILILVLFIGATSYFLGRSYISSYYSNVGFSQLRAGNLSDSYRNQRDSIALNPYNESYRINFSQTNLFVADAIIKNAQKNQADKEQTTLSENERLQVSQAIQQALAEARTAVSLNPSSAQNWANLGLIYASLLNATEGSDVWAISSYQRAINLDPRNPIYRLRLASLYYILGNYQDSTILFRQVVSLKPDWANARYNLGWSLYQQKEYQAAASEMQTVLTLLEDNKNSQDYKNAKEAYDNFKKQVELTQQQEKDAAQGEQLNLPQQQTPELKPKIELPETASPEAK